MGWDRQAVVTAGARWSSFGSGDVMAGVEPGTILKFPTETMEITATPDQTGDRYVARMTVTPGGGPGIKGFGPHIHDGSTEIFNIISGAIAYRLGRDFGDAGAGDRLEIPPGTIHGFKNRGDEPLVVDVEIVFGAGGPSPETDPVPVGVTISRLMEEGKKSRITGYTPILQLAVVEYATPKAMREAGLPGVVMPALAWLGRRVGYRPDPFATSQ